MKKKTKNLIVGNWKMNPETVSEAKKIVNTIKRGLLNIKKTEIVICPPFVYLDSLKSFSGKKTSLGTQDIFHENSGSFTSQISPNQVKQFDVVYSIVGHSEKRKLGDTDEIVNKKVINALNSGLKVIICIGEEKRDHSGEYLSFIKKQIFLALKDVSKKDIENIVIAYEPIWAIGAKEPMNTSEIHEMSIFIRKILREIYGILGDDIKILYGGSVFLENAKSIMVDGFVHGLLIGRESLNAKNFLELIKDIDKI